MRRLDVRGLIASTGTASVALLAAAVSLAGAGAASSLTIASFSLQPAGIVFALHPTAAPIAIIATAAAPLAVCQFSTSFAGAWRGGCRRLGHRPLLLPSSGGGLHIGFRVRPANGRGTRVTSLRLRWHCADHAFASRRADTKVRVPAPTFACWFAEVTATAPG